MRLFGSVQMHHIDCVAKILSRMGDRSCRMPPAAVLLLPTCYSHDGLLVMGYSDGKVLALTRLMDVLACCTAQTRVTLCCVEPKVPDALSFLGGYLQACMKIPATKHHASNMLRHADLLCVICQLVLSGEDRLRNLSRWVLWC